LIEIQEAPALRDWSMIGLLVIATIALLTKGCDDPVLADHSVELNACLQVVQKCEENTHQVDAQIQAIFDATRKEMCK